MTKRLGTDDDTKQTRPPLRERPTVKLERPNIPLYIHPEDEVTAPIDTSDLKMSRWEGRPVFAEDVLAELDKIQGATSELSNLLSSCGHIAGGRDGLADVALLNDIDKAVGAIKQLVKP